MAKVVLFLGPYKVPRGLEINGIDIPDVLEVKMDANANNRLAINIVVAADSFQTVIKNLDGSVEVVSEEEPEDDTIG